MKNFLERFAFTLLLPFLVNCHLDARLDGALTDSSPIVPSLPLAKSSLYSGQSIPLSSLFATDEYTKYTITSPDGYYDSLSNSLIIPKNLKTKSTTLVLTSPEGDTRQVSINVLGLDESFVMETPQSYGDQNYPTSGTRLSDGTLLVGTIIVDAAGGWEWAVIQRSTDNGVTWNVADYYQPYNDGEAHILAMTSQSTVAYSCGYQWDSNNYDAIHWYIRRSTDGGLTWSSSDFDSTPNTDSLCQSITVAPTTGYIYAAGYDLQGAGGTHRWILKESKDQGQTWTIIYTQDMNHYAAKIMHVRVAPDNTIWFVASNASQNAVLYKGTFSSSWSFANTGVNFGTANASNYQTYGELQITDNNTAYLSSRFGGGSWNIQRTTNGGTTWNQLYSYGSTSSDAGDFEILSDGTLLATGAYHPPGFAPSEIKIVRSTDGGTTWSASTLKTLRYGDGCLLFAGAANSVHAIGNGQNYATNFYSANSGSSWTERNFIAYTEKFYNEVYKLLILPSGSYLSVGWVGSTSKTNANAPWFAGISHDQGKTWSSSDLFTDVARNLYTLDAAYDSNGNVYVLGTSYTDHSALVRKSTDGGQSWSYVEQYIHPTFPTEPFSWTSKGHLVVDQLNNIYYGAFYSDGVNSSHVEIRKGTAGGSSWSTVNTFPQNTTNTYFGIDDFKVDKNNVLWISAHESFPTAEKVLYKSTNGGVTWTQVLRESNPGTYEEIAFDSTGNIYLKENTQIRKSLDGGSTWSVLMDSTYTPKSLLVTSNDKVFVLTTDNKILKLNSDGSWLLINDQAHTVDPSGRNHIYNYGYQIVALYQLNSDTLGIHTRYSEVRVGSVDFIKSLKISD